MIGSRKLGGVDFGLESRHGLGGVPKSTTSNYSPILYTYFKLIKTKIIAEF